MVKTETNEMMNNFGKLVYYSKLLVCAHVLCDTPLFPCEALLTKLDCSCKRKRVILLPSFHH